MNQCLLFENNPVDHRSNLLPKDGQVYYHRLIFPESSSANLMNQLQESLAWEQDQLIMFGKAITMRRKIAWVGDLNCSYTYSGIRKKPQAWTSELLLIKAKLEGKE